MKILIADSIEKEGIDLLKKNAHTVDICLEQTEEELVTKIPDYDALIVRSQTKVTKKIIEAGKKLKVIGRAGIGVDNVDVPAATRKGVLVVNAPNSTVGTTAEHTIAMMMALVRKIPFANSAVRNGEWKKNKFIGMEIRGKTVGVIGLGRIGSEVARICQRIDMNVIASDPFVSREYAQKLGVQLMSLSEVVKNSDIITIHATLTKSNHHILGKNEIESMKKDAFLINCARGGLVDESALYTALKLGRLAGAALDVFEKEPPSTSPLLTLENVIATCHIGASTKEAQKNVALEIATAIISVFKGEAVTSAVNFPYVKSMPEIRPYISLAGELGKMQSRLLVGYIKNVEIAYLGEVASCEVELVTAGFLKELLENASDEEITLVNAPLLARERGINILETKNKVCQLYSNLITTSVMTENGKILVSGTVFGKNDLRIVNIDGYHLDIKPAKTILLTFHQDKPGMVAHVADILAEEKINIGEMQVGREKIGGKAIMAITLDNQLSVSAIEKISNIKGIIKVYQV
ncbi:MAG: phosphoglycerate dehydrogenase [Candidatus Firestonebacteria bacterium]